MADSPYNTFEDVKARLDEIVGAIDDESLSLDEALSLYEEAVSIGLRASDLLEENIEAQRQSEQHDDMSEVDETAEVSVEGSPVSNLVSSSFDETTTA